MADCTQYNTLTKTIGKFKKENNSLKEFKINKKLIVLISIIL